MKRRYVQKQRADSKEETRQRIVEATAELHEELGPRATTISAIADRAGVQRLTVYRHFPDEAVLFEACTTHWLAAHPPPDPADWQDASGLERTRLALRSLYAYYRGTERMWLVSYRDVADLPALHGPMKAFGAYLDGIADSLAAALGRQARNAGVRETLRHAVQFATWRSLASQGLDDPDMADLACSWLGGLGAADRLR